MKAVFLDKDGTLVRDIPYNADHRLIAWEPFVVESLRRLQKEYALIVVSNQSGVAKNIFSESQLKVYSDSMLRQLAAEGVRIDGWYYCPHLPGAPNRQYDVSCNCRKPAPGLFFRAVKDMHLDLQRSWMVGDILDDVEAAHRSGCRAILINNGNETEWKPGRNRTPDFMAKDFAVATDYILSTGERYETMEKLPKHSVHPPG